MAEMVMAESAAFTCRVSRSTTSKPSATSPRCSHWGNGPASSPTLPIVKPDRRRQALKGSGSLLTLISRTILPVGR